MKNFRTFTIAVAFYQQAVKLPVKGDARDQLVRAARSIALNLAEGKGKRTTKDQRRFYSIAMGSLRECQALLILEQLNEGAEWELLDSLGAHLHKLIQVMRC
jgi:four helix bundle protein